MQANWSLILNVLLLIGVIAAIGRLMKIRKQSLNPEHQKPSLGSVPNSPYDEQPYNDDIIAVRKITTADSLDCVVEEEPMPQLINDAVSRPATPQLIVQDENSVEFAVKETNTQAPATIMMFLLAKENRQFAGYELLQTVLAAGLRFGEGQLFHRHQCINGQGPVMCSLAAATSTGVFDLQNIGAFSVRGLCLFMQTSKNPSIDAERFAIMLETAHQLSEGMDAHLLDDQRKQLTDDRIARYHRLLNIEHLEHECATA
ncbi:cell division protein ZipA C-terminal FtsZ-binding domain-containing protein [Legionella worsleiensis]|uniref:Cell division protein ZipA n=1 Tax=Legionella worsleiensis TaxID=45076 RepID=A0A0W1A9B1_9GAMM|nr:cell division protein ZipA C-terminal FtsZ-binding domain-containing protein [Legionella worsleiensis]KTD77935.1 cell division protein ZipA [Legionella worsleiensis]STY31642.1 cell division protein ZipA [Legionella worsleiensis]